MQEPVIVATEPTDRDRAIRAAMTAMSQLDKRTFGTDDVLDAARAARYALRVLG